MTSEWLNAAATRWLTLGFMLVAIGTLSACNTVEGLGRDVESAGDAVSDTADDAQD
jgi:predicted small secreted protein